MSVRTAAAVAATAEELDYPRGLVPPSQRGRSERLIGDVIVDLSVFEIDMGACNLIPVEVSKRYQAVPVGFLHDRSILRPRSPAR